MAQIDDQKFYKELETKKFSPIYFLYGDEPYLLNQSVQRFKYSVLDESAIDFNYNLYYAADVDVATLRDTAETLPVFSPNRLVIVKNVHEFKESEVEQLEPILRKPVEGTILVMLAEKLDKRKKLFRLMNEFATVVEFKKPFDNKIPQWISHFVRQCSLKISEEAMRRLQKLVGNNLSEIESQIFKIQDYLGNRDVIELADVNAVVSLSREESVFEFARAVGGKNRASSLEQLTLLLDQGESEQVIVNLVARHMRLLLAVKHGLDQGIGGQKLANLVNVHQYYIEGYCDQAKQWSLPALQNSLAKLHETDKTLKSSSVSSQVLLENLVVNFCS